MERRLFRSSCIYLCLFLAILFFLDLHCYPTCLCHQIIQKSLFFCQTPDHDGLSPPFPLRAHPFSLLSSFPLDLRINSTSWSKDLTILPKSDLPFLHINSQFCPVILIEFYWLVYYFSSQLQEDLPHDNSQKGRVSDTLQLFIVTN